MASAACMLATSIPQQLQKPTLSIWYSRAGSLAAVPLSIRSCLSARTSALKLLPPLTSRQLRAAPCNSTKQAHVQTLR